MASIFPQERECSCEGVNRYQSVSVWCSRQSTNTDYIRVFAEISVGLGFLWSVSYIKLIPTHEQLFAVGEKVAQMPRLT